MVLLGGRTQFPGTPSSVVSYSSARAHSGISEPTVPPLGLPASLPTRQMVLSRAVGTGPQWALVGCRRPPPSHLLAHSPQQEGLAPRPLSSHPSQGGRDWVTSSGQGVHPVWGLSCSQRSVSTSHCHPPGHANKTSGLYTGNRWKQGQVVAPGSAWCPDKDTDSPEQRAAV